MRSMSELELLQELVMAPGPPGKEDAVREVVARRVSELGFQSSVDAKGNLRIPLPGCSARPRVVVTAHLDEIAMLVRRIGPDGVLRVASLGGLYPWKCGEGPVELLASSGRIPGVLSFGSIHTNDPASRAQKAREKPLDWDSATVITGLPAEELGRMGVRSGTRCVLGPTRRRLVQLGSLVGGFFLDDRADVLAMLLALESLRDLDLDVLFVATVAEEVGGEGAQWLLGELRPEVCVALELGPITTDAPADLTATPTVWTHDSYGAMSAADGDLLDALGGELGMSLQFQAFSRGGSDASCAAARGLCARPITLGLPMENSHGFEVMHRDAPAELARLTVALLRRLCA